MVEDLGTQLLRGTADVVEARLDGRLCVAECDALLWCRIPGEALELEEHAGHRLADLVVETARDPLPLFFLRVQRSRSGLSPLGFEAAPSSC